MGVGREQNTGGKQLFSLSQVVSLHSAKPRSVSRHPSKPSVGGGSRQQSSGAMLSPPGAQISYLGGGGLGRELTHSHASVSPGHGGFSSQPHLLLRTRRQWLRNSLISIPSWGSTPGFSNCWFSGSPKGEVSGHTKIKSPGFSETADLALV